MPASHVLMLLVSLSVAAALVQPAAMADSPQPRILLVEDAHYAYTNAQLAPAFTAALQAHGYSYDTCIVTSDSASGPGYDASHTGSSCLGTYLSGYDIVVWFTGDDYQNTLTATDRTNVQLFLNGGGSLFLTGQDIGKDLKTSDDTFLKNYLHAYFCKDKSGDYDLLGKDGDPVGNGMLPFLYDNNETAPSVVFYWNSTSNMNKVNTGDPLYYGLSTDMKCSGITVKFCYYLVYCDGSIPPVRSTSTQDIPIPFDIPSSIKADNGTYKVVYFAFGFESVKSSSDQRTLMGRTIAYLSAPSVRNTTMTANATCDPADAYCSRTSNPALNATCVDYELYSTISSARYLINSTGTNTTVSLPATDGSFNAANESVGAYISVASLADGDYAVYVQCKDAAGYWGKHDYYRFAVDTVRPSEPSGVRLEAGSAYTSSAAASVEFSWFSSPSKPSYMAFSCNNATYTDWLAYPSGDAYAGLNITSAAMGCAYGDGERTVYVKMKDEAGNVRLSESAAMRDSITLDRTKPYVSSITRANGTYLKSTDTVAVTVADALSGVGTLLKWDNGNGTNSSLSNGIAFVPGWSGDGNRALQLWFSDGAGNVNFSNYSYYVDDTAPSTSKNVTTQTPTPWNSTDVTVLLSCDDASGSGCSSTKYCIDEANSCSPSTASSQAHISCASGAMCTKYLRYNSTDALGNAEATKSFTYKIDKQAPPVTINSPAAGSNISGTFTVNATATDAGIGVAWVKYNLSNATWASGAVALSKATGTDYWTTSLSTAGLTDGNYSVKIIANDSLGNANSTESVAINIDNTAPSTSSNATASDPWYNLSNVNVNLTCSDATAGCASTVYCVDDSQSGTCSISTTYPPLVPVACPSNSVCNRYVHFKSSDNAGNLETAKASEKVKMDLQKPATSDNATSSWSNNDMDVSLACSDSSGSGCNATRYCVYSDGGSCEPTAQGTVASVTCASGEVCSKRVNYTSNDTAGNSETAHNSTLLHIDKLAPSVVINSPVGANFSGTLTVNATVADSGVGIGSDAVSCNVSNATWQNVTSLSKSPASDYWTASLSTAGLTDGNYNVAIIANDSLGNANGTETVLISVDNTAPTTATNTTASDPWYAANQAVLLTCSDSGAGCNATLYCVDAASCTPGTSGSEAFVVCASGSTCTRYVFYQSNDSVGNLEAVNESYAVKIDKQAPSVTVTSPTQNGNYSGIVDILADVADAGAGVGSANYTILNATTLAQLDNGTLAQGGGWDAAWNSSNYSSGAFVLRVYANDTLGSLNATTSVTFYVDNQKPSASIVSPKAVYVASSFALDLRAARSDGNISNASYYIFSGDVIKSWSQNLSVNEGAFSFTGSVDASSWTELNYTINFTAFDNLGNNASEASWLVLDRTAPTSADNTTALDPWYVLEAVSVNITCTDSASGCSTTRYCTYSSGGDCSPSTTYATLATVTCPADSACTKYVKYNSTDAVGNVESPKASNAVKIDRKKPSTSDNVTSSWYGSDVSLRFICSDEGSGCNTTLYCDTSTACTPDAIYSAFPAVTCPSGSVCQKSIRYRSNDTAGNVEAVKTAASPVKIDKAAPTVSVTAPSTGAYVRGASYATAYVSDGSDTSGVSAVNYSMSNSTWSRSEAMARVGSSAYWNKSIETSGLTDGGYNITIMANDTVGNANVTQKVSVIVDNTAPTTTDNASIGEPWYGSAVTMNLTCSDGSGSGCVTTSFCTDSTKTCVPSTSYSSVFAIDCQDGSLCTRYVRYNSTDLTGNAEATKNSSAVKIDKQKPTTSDNATSAWSAGNVAVSIACSDGSGSGCAATKYCVDSASACIPSESGSVASVTCASGSACERYVRHNATDSAGTVGTVNTSAVVRIDRANPAVAMTVPASAYVHGSVSVTASVNDTGSGLNSVKCNVTNSTWYSVANMSAVTGSSYLWSASVSTAGFADGRYNVTIVATDNVSNANSTESTMMVVDNSAPSVAAYALNASVDSVYGDTRIYTGDAIRFSVAVADATNVSSVVATMNGTNYTLSPESSNYTNDTWSVAFSGASSVGTYQITALYANDTSGNAFANLSVGMSFKSVNGSLEVLLGSDDATEASLNETLNLTFAFNKTVSSASAVAYVPPNNASNYTQTPSYINFTAYNCSFGTSCAVTAYLGTQSKPTRLTVTGSGSNATLSVMSYLQANAPSEDAYENWTMVYRGTAYQDTARTRTPYLNISSVLCGGSAACTVNQNQAFSVVAVVDNNQTVVHTGTAFDAWARINSTVCAASASIDNITSGGSNSTNASSWTCNITSAGNYTFDFDAWDRTQAYNATRKSVNVEVNDTEPPRITNISWTGDNIINVNETLAYYVTAEDNVAMDKVWLTVNRSRAATNRTMQVHVAGEKVGIWNTTYNETDAIGNYTIPAIYANDTRGNVNSTAPTGVYSWFEVRNLTMNSSISSLQPSMNGALTVYANVSGNGSEVRSVSVNVSKPSGEAETVSLNLSSSTDGAYAGEYSGLNISGSYTASVNASLSSGAWVGSSHTFSVAYGNASVRADSNTFYLPRGIGAYNLTFFIMPLGGDLTGVNATLSISNQSVINLSAGQNASLVVGGVLWSTYNGGGITASWILDVPDAIGTANVTLYVNTTTPSATPNVTTALEVSIVNADASAPAIHGVSQQWNATNLLEAITIYVNATDSETAVGNVTVNVTPPSGHSQLLAASKTAPNWYELAFGGTNETGVFSYVVRAADVAGNVNTSFAYNFNVSADYDVTVSPAYTAYNKGENVSVSFDVRNVNNVPVQRFNATLVVNKSTENATVMSNGETAESYFTINTTDPPSGDTPAVYTLYANVSKDGNSGQANASFSVSKVIATSFIAPDDGDYFARGGSVNVTVGVRNARNETLGEGPLVSVSCPKCDRRYAKLVWYEPLGAYVEFPTFTAPADDRFSLFATARDAGLNDQGSTTPGIILTTTPPSGGSNQQQGGGGGTGAASAGGGGGGGCVYSAAEVPKNGNCNDGKDNDCDGKTDCSDDECAADATCMKIERSFEFALDTGRLQVPQGGKGVVTGTLKNAGNVDLELVLAAEGECCNITMESVLKLKPKESRAVSIEVHAALSQATGEYAIKVSASAAGAPSKSQAFTIIVKESSLITSLHASEAELSSLEKEMAGYNASGIDVSGLREALAEIKQAVEAGKAAIRENDVAKLQESSARASGATIAVKATLAVLGIQKFLADNRFSILSGILVSIILAYLIMEVTWPYYKLGKEIRKAQAAETTLVEARKQAEAQYFNRKIDDATFQAIVKDKQSQILQARGTVKLKAEERHGFVRRRMSPRFFASWAASAPSAVKRRFVRKKKEALPPLPWEK